VVSSRVSVRAVVVGLFWFFIVSFNSVSASKNDPIRPSRPYSVQMFSIMLCGCWKISRCVFVWNGFSFLG